MKASILAIGTELTTGQIINKNASTLSEKLKHFGVVVNTHLTVPDDKNLVLKALDFLEPQSDLLFITGGLGPTSDDFTRDVLAEWASVKMIFDEASWKHIQERLSSRGLTVRDMQRQQCFYPENADILFNSEGTAHGFKFKVTKASGLKTIYVLPGPPREIEAIWKAHIEKDLTSLTIDLDKIITKAWDTIGVGESDVAFKTEEALKDRPRSLDLQLGYRVHLPYVEVKMIYKQKDATIWETWVKKVDHALNDICITRDLADVATLLTQKISTTDFTFYDFVSEGYLHTRLSPYLKNLKNWSFKQSATPADADWFEHEDDFVALLPFEDLKCIVIYSLNGKRNQKLIEAPMKSPLMSERRKQYFAEMALVEVSQI
ncbi:competence/damage-inducible protein A [bacterium]|nr:competence/damage-inducible protein A [bacterium]